MPSLREGFFPPKTGIFGRKTTEYTCFWRILSPNGFGQVEVNWRADFENTIMNTQESLASLQRGWYNPPPRLERPLKSFYEG
jgi:hypothetical protein